MTPREVGYEEGRAGKPLDRARYPLANEQFSYQEGYFSGVEERARENLAGNRLVWRQDVIGTRARRYLHLADNGDVNPTDEPYVYPEGR